VEVEVEVFPVGLFGYFLCEYGVTVLCFCWGCGRAEAGGFVSFLASHCLPFIVVVELCVEFGFLA
jgi:hypothetical protein